jgi:hypothetical protein
MNDMASRRKTGGLEGSLTLVRIAGGGGAEGLRCQASGFRNQSYVLPAFDS